MLISVIVYYMCHLLALNIITIYLDTAANVKYPYIAQFIDIYDMTKTQFYGKEYIKYLRWIEIIFNPLKSAFYQIHVVS